ncbi:S-adenosylmethionine sensor upstream of mTORC1-like [Tigriopus californicus]|uniref:S-adenosylmethionine sensor upstream of mTORC1-like n=1 Tax=Tigriopus californicus TaxID=6832 RepID=UPI0027DA03D2|nr:S-adenosylmethionine sensor upstream of mTORC1-like [Tigriopus californicus]|eukprot:TCALIF_02757-PA protein Name:"Similar to CG3570 Probable methyltransferase BTM2 homolog (Drosophila melanogaster)" AED:0.34 eAED:0.34 QI:0/-1/0/1/-1/1/1/0/342
MHSQVASPQSIASRIKSVHAKLRQDCHGSNQEQAREIWACHTRDQSLLSHYASDMYTLATEYWPQEDAQVSRNTWIHAQVQQYFQGGLEQKVWQRIRKKVPSTASDPPDPVLGPLKGPQVLDVGSCYNPLSLLAPDWSICAIDLAPTPQTGVYTCDFLAVDLVPSLKGEGLQLDKAQVTALPLDYFEVVVFSLLLEYLPTPLLRYEACQRAYDVLRPGGILVIVTPDSSHQAKNFSLIRSWRIALCGLGFTRVTYEKLPHLTGLTFLKLGSPDFQSLCQDEARREAQKLALDLEAIHPKLDLMVIPQDRTILSMQNEDNEVQVETRNEDELAALFSHLPDDV